MDIRKKLIELLSTVSCNGNGESLGSCPDRKYGMCGEAAKLSYCVLQNTANHLIANGVTFATDNKWIPVTERLPEEDGKYLVFEQSGGRTNTSILRFAKDARKVDKYDFKGRWKNAWYEYDSEWGHYTVDSVTHWMPLPEPPRGDTE